MLNTEAKPKIVVAFNGLLFGNCAVWLIYIILILGNIRKHLEGMWRTEDNFGNQFSSLVNAKYQTQVVRPACQTEH